MNFNQMFKKNSCKIAIKLPASKKYLFWNSNHPKNEFTIHANINDYVNTCMPINKVWENIILYNDEPPSTLNETPPTTTCLDINNSKKNATVIKNSYGHCKGILIWNKDTIGWLIHSVPKYPILCSVNNHILPSLLFNNINDEQLKFGQSFAFLKFKYTDTLLHNLLKNIIIINANIYCMQSLVNNTNTIHKLINEIQTEVNNNIYLSINKMSINLRLFDGGKCYYIAKNNNFEIDIYEYLNQSKIKPIVIAKKYLNIIPTSTTFLNIKININMHPKENTLYCQTWTRTDTNKSNTNNKKIINIPQFKYENDVWNTTCDHSKWAIDNSNMYRVCIGDLNRMTTQHKRGGGMFIIHSKSLWNCFYNIVHFPKNST